MALRTGTIRKIIACVFAAVVFVSFNLWVIESTIRHRVATMLAEMEQHGSGSHPLRSSMAIEEYVDGKLQELERKGKITLDRSASDIASEQALARKRHWEEESKPYGSKTAPASKPQRFFRMSSTRPGHHHGTRTTSRLHRTPFTNAALQEYNDQCPNLAGQALGVCLAETRQQVNDRIFPERFKDSDLPCYHPTDNKKDADFNDKNFVTTPAKEGLFFLKLLKTASSTSAGVHLRIARNRALRDSKTSKWPVCKTRQEHGFAGPQTFHFAQRNPDESVLWTMIREPTDRLISEFFHLKVSRNNIPATDLHFQNFLTSSGRALPHYFARLWTKAFTNSETSLVNVANEIMEEYDFIGVQGRYDESLVCLMMIWNLPMSDILYVPSKLSGGYDGGQVKDTCYLIPKRKVSTGVQAFLESDRWQKYTNMELALYEAANRSLDRTIDFLGREDFELALDVFRQAQVRVVEVCGDVVRFPCTNDGVRRPNEDSDCLRGDSGCGFECLDKVATELDLW